MLDTMRKNTKIILWVTVISFVLLIFLVWGADLQQGSGPRPDVVGEVNGESLSFTSYQRVLASQRSNAQAQGRNLEPSDEIFLEEQTWNSIIEDMLLRQEALRRGLGVRDSEVRVLLLNVPPPFVTRDPSFRNAEGQFDINAYRALLNNPTTPESFLLQLEQYMRETIPTDKLRRIVTSGAKVTEDELKDRYAEETERARVSYVLVPAADMPESAPETDADVEAYYNEHAATYRVPRRVSLRYVSVPRLATAADSATVLTDLRELADQARRGEASKAAGIDDMQNSDFETLVITFSDLPTSEAGGLQENVDEVQLSPGTRVAVASLAPGQVSEPWMESGFGRLVQLVSVQDAPEGRRLSIRELGMRVNPSEETTEETRTMLEELRAEAKKRGLRAAAEAKQLPVQETSPLPLDGMAPGLAALPQAAAFGHEHEAGTISRLFMTNSSWIILEVAASLPEGTAPLTEVREQVVQDLRRQRRMDASRARADGLAQTVKSGGTLEEAAQGQGLALATPEAFTRRQGLPIMGREPEVLAAAFLSPVGTVTDPIETGVGWVVLRVEERAPVDWTPFDAAKPQLMQTLLYQKQIAVYSAFMEELRKKADIEDYRS